MTIEKLKYFTSNFLPKSGFARAVTVLAGGTAIGQAISMVSAPILTRLYSIQDFGNLQVYVSVLTFVILFSTWRYEYAILLPDDDHVAANLLVATVIIIIMMSSLIACVVWWVADSGALPDNMASLRPYLWLLPISMCGGGLYQALSYWTLRQKLYKPVAVTKLTQSISQNSAQMSIGFFKVGLVGLLIGEAFGRMVGSLSLFRLIWRKNRIIFQDVRLQNMWNAAVRYRNFPMISMGSALINTAGFSLPSLIMAKFYGTMVLGWFALEMKVLETPSTLIGQSVSQVYMSEAARLVISDPKAMRRLFLKILKRLLKLGAIPFAIIFLIAPSLFAFVFGASWREAGNYARLLVTMHYISFVVWPLMPTLIILELQTWQLLWDIARLLLTAGSLWLAYYLNWNAAGAIMAYGVGMSISYIAHLFMCYWAIQNRVQSNCTVCHET